MERQPKLNFISVDFKNGANKPFYDRNKRKYFTDSLAVQHLSNVKSIFVQYELNLKIEHEDDDPGNWRVLKNGEYFFSFSCDREEDFIGIFEQRLKYELHEYTVSHPSCIPILNTLQNINGM